MVPIIHGHSHFYTFKQFSLIDQIKLRLEAYSLFPQLWGQKTLKHTTTLLASLNKVPLHAISLLNSNSKPHPTLILITTSLS